MGVTSRRRRQRVCCSVDGGREREEEEEEAEGIQGEAAAARSRWRFAGRAGALHRRALAPINHLPVRHQSGGRRAECSQLR